MCWEAAAAAQRQRKGATLVFVADAIGETARLGGQATPITPSLLDPAHIVDLAAVDGALLFDPAGRCHAFGVILDGLAGPKGKSSRGARYNSALRYVSTGSGRFAVVCSEDGGAEFMPLLRPRVSRAAVAKAVEDFRDLLSAAELDDLPPIRSKIEQFRFYFSADQCTEINTILPQLQERSMREISFWVQIRNFQPDLELTDEYFVG